MNWFIDFSRFCREMNFKLDVGRKGLQGGEENCIMSELKSLRIREEVFILGGFATLFSFC